MFNTALYNEIASTRLFEMDNIALRNHTRMFFTHYSGLSDREKNKKPEAPFLLSSANGFTEKIYLGNASSVARWEDLDETDVVINVIRFSGPIMRNGGACAYGSMEMRDMIKQAADVKQCIGQIFIVDTPGGNSASKFDYKEALDYAHAKGQLAYMLVDGMLCSAGMAWGVQCDKIYSRNEHNLLGCMGTYAAFYSLQSGEKNSISQEVFHEVYADGSPMKNRSYRDAADGDETLIQQEVNRSNLQYIEIIKSGRPQITDEQLKGDTYEAGEVIGTICDGIRTFDEVVNEMLAAKGVRASVGGQENMTSNETNQSGTGTMETAKTTEARGDGNEKKSEQPDPNEEPDDGEPDDDNPDNPGDPNEPVDPNEPEDNPDGEPDEPDKDKDKKDQTKTNRKKNMGKKYQHIQSALELEALESNSDNSLYLHEDLCDTLEAFVEKSEQAQASLEAKYSEIKQLNEAVKNAKEAHAAEVEQLNAAHLEALKAAEEKAETEKAELVEEFNAEKAELEKQLTEAKEEQENLKATVAQKETEIAELGKEPGEQKLPEVQAPEASASASASVLPSSKGSLQEQREAHARYMEELRKKK